MESTADADRLAAHLAAYLDALRRAFETLDLRQPEVARAALLAARRSEGEALRGACGALAADDAPLALALRTAADEAEASASRLLGPVTGDVGVTILAARRAYARALAAVYPWAARLPALDAWWREAGVPPRDPAPGEAARGVIPHPPGGGHAGYALYVPEDYRPTSPRPLLVALHGAYGDGAEYVWTWVTAARSHGWLVLAPKSRDVTWSLLDPAVDIANLRAAVAEVQAGYLVDAERLWLTGLSDGGSFSYVAGLSCPSLFRSVAPVAGVLHPVTDRLLRAKQGLEVPLCIVHGARDPIFDVRGVRSTTALLQKLGYRVDYHELPDWAHAWTDDINLRLLRPWFAALT
ncbi:MAG: PHB depolymerase family esterase [Gammaproteobacteria bacterium]